MKKKKRPIKYYVYIMLTRPMGKTYTGLTSDIKRRVLEHKGCKYTRSFTCANEINKLYYFEVWSNYHDAKNREKEIKQMTRYGKFDLISRKNKNWKEIKMK